MTLYCRTFAGALYRESQLLGHGSGPATEMGHRPGTALRGAIRSLLAEYEDETDCYVAFLVQIGMEIVREPPGLTADQWHSGKDFVVRIRKPPC